MGTTDTRAYMSLLTQKVRHVLNETAVPPAVLLNHHLKQLRLPTFVRENEKIALECAQGDVDYQRYLLRLCELEHIDRERRNIERRIRQAKF